MEKINYDKFSYKTAKGLKMVSRRNEVDISSYVEVIKNIQPLSDSVFNYNQERWKLLNLELQNSVLDFQNKTISRQNVIASFRDYFEGKSGIERPFALTMIWGFSENGYGTFRTNKYFNNEDSRNSIVAALSQISNYEFENAYKSFKSIDGLGVSYISKLMYFATRALPNNKDYFLIYDIRVARSLIKITCPPEIFEIVDILPSSKYIHYDKYNKMLHRIANQNGIEADTLEMFLFDYDNLTK